MKNAVKTQNSLVVLNCRFWDIDQNKSFRTQLKEMEMENIKEIRRRGS